MPRKPRTEAHISVTGLVRDKHGKPKFNDINNIPDKFWGLLNSAEKQEINNGRNSPRRDTK